MSYLKAGIAVIVTTWENDADNPMDKKMSGLTKEQALAISRFCELFRSVNGWGKVGVGNSNTETLDFDELATKMTQSDLDLLKTDLGETPETLYEYLIGSWCDGEYVRVFESIKFLNVPVDIEEIKLE